MEPTVGRRLPRRPRHQVFGAPTACMSSPSVARQRFRSNYRSYCRDVRWVRRRPLSLTTGRRRTLAPASASLALGAPDLAQLRSAIWAIWRMRLHRRQLRRPSERRCATGPTQASFDLIADLSECDREGSGARPIEIRRTLCSTPSGTAPGRPATAACHACGLLRALISGRCIGGSQDIFPSRLRSGERRAQDRAPADAWGDATDSDGALLASSLR